MAKVRLTKEFSFEMAHTLSGYDGACREIHGHSYKLFVTIIGEPIADENNPKMGMVVDFSVLKKIVGKGIVDRYDHAFLIRETPNNSELIKVLRGQFEKLEVTPYQPTCENMVTHFAQMIAPSLPEGVELVSVKLYETATSYAEWLREDNV